ncbi:MAG: hypothetical protein FWF86_06325 [Clostridia bacterium]|nr:hypothetical protein [Clostridia bacterium]
MECLLQHKQRPVCGTFGYLLTRGDAIILFAWKENKVSRARGGNLLGIRREATAEGGMDLTG